MNSNRPSGPRQLTAATLAIATPLGLGLSLVMATPAQARVNVHCAGGASSRLGPGDAWSAGVASVDPIVSRGTPVSMHEHQFFGNLDLLNMARPDLANYADMVEPTDKTSCNIAKDTAAYWAPNLRFTSGPNAGKLVPIMRYEMYYQSWNDKKTDPAKATRPFPKDLRMVAGNPNAMSEADMNTDHVNFTCGNFSSKSAREGFRFKTPQAADCSTARNLKEGENRFLTAIVHFPTCWSGRLNDHTVDGNTADFMGVPGAQNNQLAYVTPGGRCPAGFPVKLPKARFTWQWDYRGDGTDIAFSSGMGEAKGKGFTFHADFWNTWNQSVLIKTVNYCINTTRPEESLHIGNTPRKPGLCGIPVP